ncbi:MAG: hypothetical protein AAF658_11420, partial [Myxococcota bacterium]
VNLIQERLWSRADSGGPSDTVFLDIFTAVLFLAVFALVNFLGYAKVHRDRAETRFLFLLHTFSKNVEGGVITDERIVDILRKTELIRQSITVTRGESFHVSIPILVAWPATSVRHYFGLHILNRSERFRTSSGEQYSNTRDWTAVWMGAAPSDLNFTMKRKAFGDEYEIAQPGTSGRIPREKIPELTEVLKARHRSAIEVREGRLLAVRPLRARFVFFGVQPIPDAEIVATATALDLWK